MLDLEEVQADLERATGGRRLDSGDSLVDVLCRLDEYARAEELDSKLCHYLAKRSYVKAIQWFANPDTPHNQ